MASERFQGWKNFETFSVFTDITNDRMKELHWIGSAEIAYDDSRACETFSRIENATFKLLDMMKEEYEEQSPDSLEGIYSVLLSQALAEVSFHQIARHLVNHVVSMRKGKRTLHSVPSMPSV